MSINTYDLLKQEIESSVFEKVFPRIREIVDQALRDIKRDDLNDKTLTINKARLAFGLSRKTVLDIINLCGVETEKNQCSLPGASESLTFSYSDFAVARRKAEKMGVKIRASHGARRDRRAKKTI